MSPSPKPSPDPSPTGAGLDFAACDNPESPTKANTASLPDQTQKASPLRTHEELGEGVGESLERVAHQDWAMIGFATDDATPIRVDTDNSWAHTAKETASPFQQSCRNPFKPIA